MTASKSSRAGTRDGGQSGGARKATTAGTAVKSGSAKDGSAVRGGTAVKDGGRDQPRTVAARNRAAGRGARSSRRMPPRAGPLWLQVTTFVLALAGLGVSIYLTIAHFTESTLAGCWNRGW